MKNILLFYTTFFTVCLFGQTSRGLYNINFFPEIENTTYNSLQKSGNTLVYGNIPNNSLRSDYYTFGFNSVLYHKDAVTIATNLNYVGEFLIRKNNVNLSYNYHLNFTRKVEGAFGLSLGVLNSSLNREKSILKDPFDPIVQVLSEHSLNFFDPKISGQFSFENRFSMGLSYNSFPTKYISVYNHELLNVPNKLNVNLLYKFDNNTVNFFKYVSIGVWYQKQASVSRINLSVSKRVNNQIGFVFGFVNNPNLFHAGLNFDLGRENKLYFNSGINTGNKNFGNGTEVEFKITTIKSTKEKYINLDSLADSNDIVNSEINEQPTKIEYVYIVDTMEEKRVSIYSPDPNDLLVEIANYDDFTRVRLGHDTSKIYFKSVKDLIFKPGYYLMIKMSSSEAVIDTEMKKLFTLGVLSYKLYDPKLSVYYQFVDWTLDEVENSKQIQYYDKEFKFLWTKLFK